MVNVLLDFAMYYPFFSLCLSLIGSFILCTNNHPSSNACRWTLAGAWRRWHRAGPRPAKRRPGCCRRGAPAAAMVAGAWSRRGSSRISCSLAAHGTKQNKTEETVVSACCEKNRLQCLAITAP